MSSAQPRQKRSDLLKEIEKLRDRVQELENAAVRSDSEGTVPQGLGAEPFHQMVEFVPDAVCILLDERFVFINTHGVKMVGAKTADELLGRNIWDFCQPNYWDLGKSRYSQCINGNDYLPPAEFELIRLNGEVITVESSARPITYDRRRAILAVWRDISHRKQAEDALHESEDRFRMLVESAPIGIFTTSSSGQPLAINLAMARILGFPSPEEALEHFTDLSAQLYVHAERRNEFIRLLRSFGRVEQFEYQARTAAGSIIWLSMNARVSERREDGSFIIEGFTTDITDRKLAENAQRESEARFRVLVEGAPDAIFVQSGGRFAYLNSAACRLFGASRPEDLLGMDCMERIAPEYHGRIRERIRFQRETGNPAALMDQKYLRLDGSRVPVETTAVSIRYQGEDAHMVFVRDITTRKQAEAYREMGREILQILNEPGDLQDSIQRVLAALKVRTGFDAVGIRLQDGDDFPYFAQQGFSKDFLLTENTLIEHAANGGVCRDKDGNIHLECTCGLVISGKTEPANPLFTPGGSFWTNDSFPLLDIPPDEDPRLHPRNQCIHQGYASVALVPIRNKDRIVGLIQLNDRRKERFTLAAVEILEGIASHIGAALMRKRAEEALRDSEERHRKIVEASTDAILVRSGEIIVYANPAALALFRGSHMGDLVGTRYLDLVHPDDRAESVERIRKGRNEKWIAPPREHRILAIDGQVVHVESTGVPVQYQGETQIFGVFRDITSRKQVENNLRLSQARHRTLIENIPFMVFLKDRESNYTSINQAYASELKIKPEEAIGKTDFDFYPKDLAERFRLEDKRVIETGERFEIDESYFRDGSKRVLYKVKIPVRDNVDKIIGVLGTISDITERKQAEADLKDSEERFRTAFENASIGMAMVGFDGIYQQANTAMAQMIGYRPADLVGKRVADFTHPDDLGRRSQFISNLIEGKPLSGEQERRFVHRNGSTVWTRIWATVQRDHNEKPLYFISLIQDITDRKLADQNRKELENHLQQAQKMEAIGALAGGIAHDFNNILSAIIGYTELAMLNEGAEHCIVELKEALTAANRAKDLVKQILAFSRQTDEERMPVRVALVAKEAVKFLRATIPATIEIKTHIDEKSGAVLANSVELHQIIMNLCTNAQHAIGEQAGLLEVEVQNSEIDIAQKNDLIDLEAGSYVRISVKDTGYGMTPDVMERIFDPYFTTKEKGVGTGLGLAVVHGIVKKNGGAIKVESDLGKGTTFHIYLPKADFTAPITAEPPKPIAGGSERILFVDDEKMLVAVGQQALQHLGYDVVSRTSPIEALELFKAKPDHFDLVITDQTMPGMTGDALARELLRIRPALPVIICTGYSQTIDRERAKQIGIKAFVMKPILINEIAGAIRKVLDNE